MREIIENNGPTALASDQIDEACEERENAKSARQGASPSGLNLTPQERRRQRIALVAEFGGAFADLKKAAREAVQRGMYSPRTNRGDIESSLLRTWKHRHRDYQR